MKFTVVSEDFVAVASFQNFLVLLIEIPVKNETININGRKEGALLDKTVLANPVWK